MNICLVFPRFKLPTGDPPLGLAYIASYIRKHLKAKVFILDATFHPSFEYITSSLKEIKPEVVGIYFGTMMYNDGVKVAEIAKKLNAFVVAGGPHATAIPETLVDKVDVVAVGEGEKVFLKILEEYKERKIDKIVKNEDFVVLDNSLFPAWELLEMRKYIAYWHYLDSVDISLRGTNIIGSRGCPFNCTYCQPILREIFGRKVRFRNPENILDEIRYLKKNYSINAIFFHDDTLTFNKKWVYRLCDLLSREKIFWGANTRVDTIDENILKVMYKAGLRNLHIGVETFSERILSEIYKKGTNIEQIQNAIKITKKIGIFSLCFFMLGAPTETKDEIINTIKLASQLPIEEATFAITTPIPGTYLHQMIKEDKRYILSGVFSSYNYYSKRSFSDPNLSNFYLKYSQIKALITFYTHPYRWKYILGHLSTYKGLKKLIRKVRRSLW